MHDADYGFLDRLIGEVVPLELRIVDALYEKISKAKLLELRQGALASCIRSGGFHL